MRKPRSIKGTRLKIWTKDVFAVAENAKSRAGPLRGRERRNLVCFFK
jgi:hypothetical protein